jgi:hypothetical protein
MILDIGKRPSDSIVGQERFASIENNEAAPLESVLEKVQGYPDCGEFKVIGSPLLEAVAATQVTFVGQVEG